MGWRVHGLTTRFSYYRLPVTPARTCRNCASLEARKARVTYHLSGKQARDYLPFYHCPIQRIWVMALKDNADGELERAAADCEFYDPDTE